MDKNLLAVDEIRKKAGENDIEPNILKFVSVGRIDTWKAYDRLFEILQRLFQEGYRSYWTIVGGGEDFEQIRALFSDSKLRGYVKMTGQLSNPYPYIKDADVALLSKYEGLPNTIFEALVLGTPVVATNVGSISTQIIEGQNGWLVENNEESIYQGLKYILDHPEEIKRFREDLKSYQYDNASVLKTAEMVLFGE